MDEFQRTSLAEFSRLYLRSRQPDRDKLNVQLGSNAPSDLSENNFSENDFSENNFAVQMVLGMSKKC